MNILNHSFWGFSVITVMMVCAIKVNAAQEPSSPKVQYYSHQQVDDAFAKGAKLTEGKAGKAVYQVLTASREGPGEVELHAKDTDIFYIVEGSATFVTGGKVVGGQQTAPDEVRGKSIEGGTPHHLGPEDIIIIPAGVPHWYKSVKPPFRYLVIKVR